MGEKATEQDVMVLYGSRKRKVDHAWLSLG